MIDLEKERELFECWCEYAQGLSTYMIGDEYEHRHTELAWLSWQASVTREGYKLVPVEMSLEKADELSIIEWDKNKHLFQSINRGLDVTQVEEFRIRWCKTKARQLIKDYKEMVEGVI